MSLFCDEIVLEMKDITKKFGAVTALNKMSFSVKKGEIHAICGENGAGKSTLMKILHGYYTCNSYDGEIFINGAKVELMTPTDSRKAGIAMIYQEINVLSSLSVAENIFASRMPLNKFGLVSFRTMFQEAYKYLDMINIKIDSKEKMGSLNTSQQQLVLFAKALAEDTKILILDEPTSSLTINEITLLMKILCELRQKGITCIYISHKLDEIVQIADRCTVIRDGESVITLNKEDFNMNTIVSAMVGRNIEQIFPDRISNIGDEVLRVENLSVQHKSIKTRKVVDEVSFNLRKGEILGIAGLVGSGRSEILNAIYGSIKKINGNIYLSRTLTRIDNTFAAVKNGMVLLTEDRHGSGLFLQDKDIKQNITAVILNYLKKGISFDFKKERALTDEMMKRLSIKARNGNTRITSLSGGNQQKVCFGKCLAVRPSILLLDEPTRGIDVGSKIEIYELIYKLAENGMSIIVVSSELLELLNICDRFIVISQGRLKGELSRSEASDKKIMELAIS